MQQHTARTSSRRHPAALTCAGAGAVWLCGCVTVAVTVVGLGDKACRVALSEFGRCLHRLLALELVANDLTLWTMATIGEAGSLGPSLATQLVSLNLASSEHAPSRCRSPPLPPAVLTSPRHARAGGRREHRRPRAGHLCDCECGGRGERAGGRWLPPCRWVSTVGAGAAGILPDVERFVDHRMHQLSNLGG